MNFSKSGEEERMGKLRIRITMTSEEQKSNVLLEKCTLEFIFLVQGNTNFHTCGAEHPFLRMKDCFISQMQTVVHTCVRLY